MSWEVGVHSKFKGSTSCLKHRNVPHNIGTMFSRECEINSFVDWLRNLVKLNGEDKYILASNIKLVEGKKMHLLKCRTRIRRFGIKS